LVERSDVHDLFALPTLDEHRAVPPVVDVEALIVKVRVVLPTEAALSPSFNLVHRLLVLQALIGVRVLFLALFIVD
jgi:hypothetical protein